MCHRKRTVDIESVKKYIASSLKIDSPQMRLICATAKENKIAVMLGFSENENQSLYISQALIGADGEIKMTRRKIKPTHMERTIYGDGSGASLNNVVDLPGIGKVGGLCCWEHTQPLLRYHTYTQGEEFHVAAWPPMLPLAQTPDALWSQAAEGNECSTSRSKNSVRAKFSNFSRRKDFDQHSLH
jgi:predicted amidohydrolase